MDSYPPADSVQDVNLLITNDRMNQEEFESMISIHQL